MSKQVQHDERTHLYALFSIHHCERSEGNFMLQLLVYITLNQVQGLLSLMLCHEMLKRVQDDERIQLYVLFYIHHCERSEAILCWNCSLKIEATVRNSTLVIFLSTQSIFTNNKFEIQRP